MRVLNLKTSVLLSLVTVVTHAAIAAEAGADAAKTTQITGAVVAPLNDLNLVKKEIPQILRELQKAPYSLSSDASCSILASEIRELDIVLGDDVDAPVDSVKTTTLERGKTEIGKATVGAIKNTAEGVIPFRGWVRKLSGADRHANDITLAYSAGSARRAFLKGVRFGKNCTPVESVVTQQETVADADPVNAVQK